MSDIGKFNLQMGSVGTVQVGDNPTANINQVSMIEISGQFDRLMNEQKVNPESLNETAKMAEKLKDTLKKLPKEMGSFLKDLSVGVLVELLTRKIP